MIEKRFTIKSQDDLFGVVDNYSPDKICVVNGIRTEIETKWLCNVLNDLNDENEQLKEDAKQVLFVLACCDKDFGLSINEAKAIKRLNECVDGCYNTEGLLK